MENWAQRLENIDKKFTQAYDKNPRFDLLGKSSDELSEIEKASFHKAQFSAMSGSQSGFEAIFDPVKLAQCDGCGSPK